ncbi:DUF4861 family protein [uncultured Flavobacterium sp.]|uniref:DUF4861 family protein n=1 Tax=uncultured Flavobacterium sp. TaxID=165435 RepID=UPI002593E7EB|nr:DUF4861 family protein [uncultured Flavobacterium sp.]
MKKGLKKLVKVCFLAVLALSAASCKSSSENEVTVEVKNNLDFDRKEVVSIERSKLEKLLKNNLESEIKVKSEDSGKYLRTQWIDYNGDGKGDEFLFQAEVKAGASAAYLIVAGSEIAPESKAVTFSRFVPERIDDYAWENNRVAFRAYGPTAQKLVEEGKEGGTLSSGIDLWFKKVDYSIIDSWYRKNVSSPGYYHMEHGEGYDPYHVGASRGTGGGGIWEQDSLQVAKNFVNYKTIAKGPLRTVFELTYAPWSSYGVHEVKRISLDLDSNFSKFEITYRSEKKIPNYTLGITLHEKKGEVNINKLKGWIRYWEKVDSSYVGEGIVLNPKIIDTAFAYDSKVPDQSNLLVSTKPNARLVYYAGFSWTGSGQITDVTQWDQMLGRQAEIAGNPLKITIK